MMQNALSRQQSTLKRNSANDQENITLPKNISEIFRRDPRLVGFIAARHKFVAKILSGLDILEIGCQEGFGTFFISPYVKTITCVDFYPPFIEGFAKYSAPHLKNCKYKLHDITAEPVKGPFDGAFALDVLEHIDPSQEFNFWKNLCGSLAPNGTAIIGMPSLESQVYASEASKAGHVNCKSGEDLKKIASDFFNNVIMFSMNDENLHNGFLPMSHYLLAVCSCKR
jgi:2-polyprenyl-3-methyl-5-hydroxy-6-metoxy-1,4-benzoquinol methylase